MGYLGLDQTEIKEDNMFQRLFWPSDHAGEADNLGQQGFWVCLSIAVLSFLVLMVQGHWLLAPVILAIYALGGIGVREHSQPAAILVAALYIMDTVAAVMTGHLPGVIQLGGTVLLLANIRGTWIAAKWAAQGAEMPERYSETFKDKLVDQVPARVWPKAKIPFFCLAGLYALVSVFGVVALSLGVGRRAALEPGQQPTQTVTLHAPNAP